MVQIGSRDLSKHVKGVLDITIQDFSGNEIGTKSILLMPSSGTLFRYVSLAHSMITKTEMTASNPVDSPWKIVAFDLEARDVDESSESVTCLLPDKPKTIVVRQIA